MDKYKLYGITLIKDDSSLKAFADSVVEIIGIADIVEGSCRKRLRLIHTYFV